MNFFPCFDPFSENKETNEKIAFFAMNKKNQKKT